MLSGSLMNILAAAGRGCTPPSTPQLSTQLMDQSLCFSSAQLYITPRVSSRRRDTNCEGRLFTQAFITQGLQRRTGSTGADWTNQALLYISHVDSPLSHSVHSGTFYSNCYSPAISTISRLHLYLLQTARCYLSIRQGCFILDMLCASSSASERIPNHFLHLKPSHSCTLIILSPPLTFLLSFHTFQALVLCVVQYFQRV